jgi:hypothetical protein
MLYTMRVAYTGLMLHAHIYTQLYEATQRRGARALAHAE